MIVDILLSIITMAFAIMVVFSKKTVVAALSLLMTMVCIALIYFQLGTIFLAAVQILINAGAIAILFVFVMMLINLEEFENNKETNKLKIVITGITVTALFLLFSFIISSNIETLSVNNITDNSMYIIFDKLFTSYYIPFEMASVLLLASMVASVLIATTNKEDKKKKENINE